MKILITGGTGFVGGHAIQALAPRHELFAIARGAVPPALEPHAEWVAADLSRPLDAGALPGEIDAVLHLAQSRRYMDLPEGAEDVIAINLRATEELVAYARRAGAARFVLASTGGVYARSPEPIHEDGRLDPADDYFRSKRDAELVVAAAEGSLLPLALRPFFVYGPGQERMLVAGLMRRVAAGEEVVIEGDPGLRTNPIYVADAVAAIEASLSADRGGVFNLAGDERVSITELVRLIGEAVGREPRIRHVAASSGADLVGDNERMRRILGATPRTSLRDGLAAMTSARGS